MRRVLPNGTDGRPVYADIVGDLLAVGDDAATLDTRHGQIDLPLAEVVLAKLAHPATRDELALEAVAARGWRSAETGAVGGWLLRANGGFTQRANSVLPLKAPGLPLEAALQAARDWYAERGLPLRLQVPTEARRLLDASLAEDGWTASPDVAVLAARLDLVAAATSDVDVDVADEPDDDWFARYRDGGGSSEVARALLTRHDNAGFAAVREGGRVVAIGRGAIDDGWLGVTAVEVDPDRRRQGLAIAVMDALHRWGRERGATRAYLQVEEDNTAAVALYERLGYWQHHSYRFRLDPGTAG